MILALNKFLSRSGLGRAITPFKQPMLLVGQSITTPVRLVSVNNLEQVRNLEHFALSVTIDPLITFSGIWEQIHRDAYSI
jgi:hypothetical protein